MDTVTRTFSTTLSSTYTANSIIELSHFRDMTFDLDERVGIYLEAWMCNLNLKSFLTAIIPEFDGDETEAEKMAKFTAAENKSQKLGLRILGRKNNTGDWQEKAEITLVNRGRKDYFDLLQPYLAKNTVRILEKNDALAVQLVDYGNGLLKNNDLVGIELGVTITIAKKNNMDIFNARLAALELALENRLINVPANTLLGRDTATGTIQTIPQSRFATSQQIDQAIIDWIGTAPENLNTLIEISTALANDPNFAATIVSQLALKAPLANPSFTGTVGTSGQISFPAVQNPSSNANTLDDYEEGVWTPILTYTIPGTSSITFSRNTGRYQKIGNRVFVAFDIRVNTYSKGTASGYLIISGLPFTPRAGAGYDNNFGFLLVGNSPFSGIPNIQTATGLSSSNVLFIFKAVSGSVNVALDDPMAGALYWGQINYEVS